MYVDEDKMVCCIVATSLAYEARSGARMPAGCVNIEDLLWRVMLSSDLKPLVFNKNTIMLNGVSVSRYLTLIEAAAVTLQAR